MKKRFSALALVCLVGVLGWFLVGFRPARSQLGTLNEDVKQAQTQVSDLEARLQRLLALRDNKDGVRDRAIHMVAALPSNPSLPDFVVKVQDAANSAGIDFLSVAPSLPAVPVLPASAATAAPATAPAHAPSRSGEESTPSTVQPEAQAPLRSITTELTADGGFFEIERFVLNLEKLGRAVKIDTINLTSKDEPGKLSASLKLQIFMLVPQAAASATQPASGGA